MMLMATGPDYEPSRVDRMVDYASEASRLADDRVSMLPPREETDPVTGLPWWMVREIVGYYESGGNYQRKNSKSTAAGKYQFLTGTARDTLKRMGMAPRRATEYSPYMQDRMFEHLWERRSGRDWYPSETPHGQKRGWAAEIADLQRGIPYPEVVARRKQWESGKRDFKNYGWWRDYPQRAQTQMPDNSDYR